MKDNMLYEFSDYGLTAYYKTIDSFKWADCYTHNVKKIVAVGGEIYGIANDRSELYNYKAIKMGDGLYDPSYQMQEISIGISAQRIEPMCNYLLVTSEGVTSTQKHKVTMNGNTPVVEILDSKIYADGLIIISPLN